MATLEQLEAALRAADAAGNTEDAKRLAQAYAAARSAQRPQQQASPAPAPAQNPTDGMSGLQKFAAGVGKSLVDTGHGLAQAGTDAARYFVEANPVLFGEQSASDWINGVSRRGLNDLVAGQDHSLAGRLKAKVAQQQAEADARKAQDAPLMNSGAGFAGDIVGQVGQLAIPVGEAAKGVTGARALALAAGKNAAFAAAQPVTSGESRGQNIGTAAALGALGQGLQSGVARVGKGMADKITPEVMALYQKAQAAGIPVHFSQLSDSKFVKTLASTLGYLPFSGASGAQRTQQEAFNRAASRGFGHEAPVLTDDVMTAAKRDIGKGYDAIFGRNNVSLDKQAVADLFKLHASVGNDLEASQAAVARKQIEKILDNAGQAGSMPGKVYQSLRGQLRDGFGKESPLGRKVMEARKILDDAASRSLGPADAVMLKVLNGQYANMSTVRDALKQVEGAKGNVKPSALWNLVRNGSTKDMRELAKIGQVLLKDQIPDSGTAGRLLATGGLGTAGLTGGAGALPLLKLLLAGATVGRVANSPVAARYLTQGNKPISGLARLLQPAPQALPAAARAAQQ